MTTEQILRPDPSLKPMRCHSTSGAMKVLKNQSLVVLRTDKCGIFTFAHDGGFVTQFICGHVLVAQAFHNTKVSTKMWLTEWVERLDRSRYALSSDWVASNGVTHVNDVPFFSLSTDDLKDGRAR